MIVHLLVKFSVGLLLFDSRYRTTVEKNGAAIQNTTGSLNFQ